MTAGSPRGVLASAFLYTLVETAKAIGIEQYFYLRYLFLRFPLCSINKYAVLLPRNLTYEDLNFF